jgi:drug/metabolite transporter (DMT)-like permease
MSEVDTAPLHRQGIIALVACGIVWSTGGLLIKWLPFSAYTILFYRSVFAALLFLIIYRQKAWRLTRKSALVAVLYAGLLSAFVVATKLTTAANAIFLQYTAPIYVLLLEPLLYKVPLRRYNVITIAACLLGMVLFFLGGYEAGGQWSGIALAILSGVFLAAFTLAQRGSEAPESGVFWGNVLVFLIWSFDWIHSPSPTLTQWGLLAFLGLVQIGLGYLLFNYGLRHTSATESSLITMLEPILNPVWVFLGYGEVPAALSIAGGLIILAALAWRIWKVARSESSAEERPALG